MVTAMWNDTVWKAQYTRPNTEAAAVDDFYAALAIDYRAALKSGRVQLVGHGTFGGRHVDWLRVVSKKAEQWYVLRTLGDVGIDASDDGVIERKTAGADFQSGVSADQLAAQQLGDRTRLPSLELAVEKYRGAGNCDSGYSCATFAASVPNDAQ